MRIEIRRGNMKPAIIITFHTKHDRFESDYEKTKFFRELHGWKQTVPGKGKRYVYNRPGLLDEIEHAKIADSVFVAAMEHMKEVERFFREWEGKVEWDMREIMMARKDLEDMMRKL